MYMLKNTHEKWDKMKSLIVHYEISKFNMDSMPQRRRRRYAYAFWRTLYLGSVPIVVKAPMLCSSLDPIIQLEVGTSFHWMFYGREKLFKKHIKCFLYLWSNLIRGNECEIKNCVLSYSLWHQTPDTLMVH